MGKGGFEIKLNIAYGLKHWQMLWLSIWVWVIMLQPNKFKVEDYAFDNEGLFHQLTDGTIDCGR